MNYETTASIASQRLDKTLLRQQRGNHCVTTEKLNCPTRCFLVGTRMITLRGLLVDDKKVRRPVRK
jgi:hypothetical protein